MSRDGQLEPEASQLYEELCRRLTYGRWMFEVFVLSILGVAIGIAAPLGIIFGLLAGIFSGPLPYAFVAVALVVLAVSYPVSRSKGKQFWEAYRAEDVIYELIQEEWRTGRDVLPSTLQWPEHWQQVRHATPPTDAELQRMRRGKRLARFFVPLLVVALVIMVVVLVLAILGPRPVRDFLGSAGGLPFLLIAIVPLVAWVAFIAFVGRLKGRLRTLEAVEEESHRRILPQDLTHYKP